MTTPEQRLARAAEITPDIRLCARDVRISHIWHPSPRTADHPLLTIASVEYRYGDVLAYGAALCGPEDNPSRPEGRSLALRRAYGALVHYALKVKQGETFTQFNDALVDPYTHRWVVHPRALDPVQLIQHLRQVASPRYALSFLRGYLAQAVKQSDALPRP